MEDLPAPPPDDDLSLAVESLKLGLTARATGGGMEESEYRRLRKLVVGHPVLGKKVPRFLKVCHSTDDFWQFIKAEFDNYAARRIYLAEKLNPLLDELESGEIAALALYERIDPPLGQGGFGVVMRYRHRLLDMDFAVKVFAPAFSEGGEGHLDRFFREARILFQLNHPDIIRVHDVGMLGKRPFIRMELFDGDPPSRVLKERGTVPADRALWLVKRVADALKHAHEDVQVVHRDLKPSNIMVKKPGQLRVIDFGLGVFIEQELISRITRTGQGVVGGHYTAPELVQDPKLIDPRSDIYSLGVLWFEMLVGRVPGAMDVEDALSGRCRTRPDPGSLWMPEGVGGPLPVHGRPDGGAECFGLTHSLGLREPRSTALRVLAVTGLPCSHRLIACTGGMMTLKFDEVGHWSEIKLAIVQDYAQAYSNILSKQTSPRFHHVYVDGFSGAGLHISRETGEFIQGSPLNALAVKPPFREHYLVDLDGDKVEHLQGLVGERQDVNVLHGDCNQVLLGQVFPNIRWEQYRRGLCLLDPYGLQLKWEVLAQAGAMRTLDIFLNFPVMDMNRNALWRNPEGVAPEDLARMTAFWGDESWREVAYHPAAQMDMFNPEATDKATNEDVAEGFRQRLREVAGFSNVPKPMPMRNSIGAIVYYLFFASHKPVANKIIRAIFSKYAEAGS